MHVYNKCASSVYALNRCKNLLNSETLKMMYFGLVHSYLTYGVCLWGAAPKHNLRKITTLQKKAVRAIFHKPPGTPSNPLFKRAKILKMCDLQKLCCLKLLFRKKQTILPPLLSDLFTFNSDIHAYGTRQTLHAHVFPFTFAKFKLNFIYVAIIIWNSIPNSLKREARWGAIVQWFKRDRFDDY